MQEQSHRGCHQSGLRTHKQQKKQELTHNSSNQSGVGCKKQLKSGVNKHRAANSQESLHAKAAANQASAHI